MLRRFETYGFHERTTGEQVDELARVLRRAGLFIPEVLASAVGRNRSAAGVDLVWEHAYESADAYARYMCHPYHICILDRYLLPEAPECITASRRELKLGLLGYEIEGAPFRRVDGIRRVVAMVADPSSSPDEWSKFADSLTARVETVPEMPVSVVAENTMGLEWFPDGWTHVWEQAFNDEAAMARAVADESAVLDAGPVARWIDIHYRIEVEPPTGAVA
jgi:hypothetical protein